jgi:tetratricopeptide (TPR) repeat protein
MAYNASAMMPGAEDRWRWVQNGIRLLRDEGLRRNPGDPLLYRELGWLFADKIGGYSDSEHMYYRVRWAAEMTALLGGGRAAAAAARPETARRMSAEYGLEPALMAEVEAEHGLQDWRLPEPHSLYWARRGRARAGARGSLECDRMICQALAARFMQGWLRFSPEEGVYATGPAPGAYAAALSALESARARHGGMMDAALGQFLRDAALVLHEFGREAEARDAFLRLQRELPSDPAAAAGFDAFIEQRTSPEGMRDGPLRRAVAVVEGTCFRGELLRAAGRGAEAEALEERARSLWEARAGGEDADERRRMGFPEFEEIRAQAALRAREETPGTPPGPAGRGNGAGGGA